MLRYAGLLIERAEQGLRSGDVTEGFVGLQTLQKLKNASEDEFYRQWKAMVLEKDVRWEGAYPPWILCSSCSDEVRRFLSDQL